MPHARIGVHLKRNRAKGNGIINPRTAHKHKLAQFPSGYVRVNRLYKARRRIAVGKDIDSNCDARNDVQNPNDSSISRPQPQPNPKQLRSAPHQTTTRTATSVATKHLANKQNKARTATFQPRQLRTRDPKRQTTPHRRDRSGTWRTRPRSG